MLYVVDRGKYTGVDWTAETVERPDTSAGAPVQVGLVVKPAAGLADFTQRTADGIRAGADAGARGVGAAGSTRTDEAKTMSYSEGRRYQSSRRGQSSLDCTTFAY